MNENRKKLKELLELFDHNIKQYKGKSDDEAKTRVDFIDKFFLLLGWDLYNEQGYSEQYREVVREARVEIKGKVKAPDYCFRIGIERKFFVEAKKPSVDIKHDIVPAFQLRRYAYTAKLPLSILTDFEEFAVYDTRIKPHKNDKASTARIFYCTYQDYEKEFDFIFNTFSKEAILKGSFDKYIEDNKRKKGTSEVDKEFLKLIEKWRENLAKNIALRNKDLSIYELNYAVQKIIDRIIFLRIAEDRHMEDYGRIQKLLEIPKTLYPQLVNLFVQADVKYNSSLFDSIEDKITPDLKIDDKILKDIIKDLYYPDSPYEFSVFDVEILGNIYEQFLGKTIRLTPGHQAKVEDKPEVKKAGGVYYTPKYIVDYIVKHTVGEKIKDKNPSDIAKLKILDPACGSGSFLLGAYQLLMDYHLEFYTKVKNINKALKDNKIYQLKENEYRLTIEEKHNILLSNIFGVDIDTQAVEVTKLSLLLKLLEGESQESTGLLFKYTDIKLLPDLSNNIKCGNSLIGPDFYETGQMSLFQDDETVRRINVFDWEKEFADIFQQGGFDVVIGNPPYIRIQNMKEYAPDEVEFFKENYKSASKGNYDIYVIFIEKGLSLLNKNGKLGYIVPHKFFNSNYGEPLRELISQGSHLSYIVHFGDNQIFKRASTYTCLLFLNRTSNNKFKFKKIDNIDKWKEELNTDGEFIISKDIDSNEWNFFSRKISSILRKLTEFDVKLKDVALRIFQGPITSADNVFLFKNYRKCPSKETIEVYSKSLKKWIPLEADILKNVIRSGKIFRYFAEPTALVLFPYKIENLSAELYNPEELKSKFPLTWNYFQKNKSLLQNREKGKFKDNKWYRFGRTQNLGMWEQSKILVPYMINKLSSYFDEDENYYFVNVTTGGYGITLDSTRFNYKYICGLLNSRVLDFYLKKTSTNFRGGYFAANKQYIEQLPIRTVESMDTTEKLLHDTIIELVDQMLELQKKYHPAKIETDKNLFKKQIDIIDNQIDQLVYELYGLTDEEIKIVEGND